MKIDSSLLFSNCLGVFQGGGCKAIAYVGAYRIAYENRIGFSHVAGTSAGAIFAALIAAGATPEKMNSIALSDKIKRMPIESFPFKNYLLWAVLISCVLLILLVLISNLILKSQTITLRIVVCAATLTGFWSLIYTKEVLNWIFRHSFSIYKKWGAFSSGNIEKTVSEWLHEIMPGHKGEEIKFSDLPINLAVYSCNVNKNIIEVWSTNETPDKPVAKAVAASCSIPLYFTPTVMTKHDDTSYYVDGGLLINRPDHTHNSFPTYFQALSFKLTSPSKPIEGFFGYIKALLNTLIQGADFLQHTTMNTESPTDGHEGVNEVEINTGEIAATDFRSLTEEEVKSLIESGEAGMCDFLKKMDARLSGSEGNIDFTISPNRTIKENDGDYILNQVAFWSYEKNDSIWVSDYELDWVWPLFPTLLSWIQNKSNVTAFYDKSLDTDPPDQRHEAKKRLLESLGVQLRPILKDQLILGYYFIKNDKSKCILYKKEKKRTEDEKSGNNDDQYIYDGKVYNGEIDSIFIKRIIKAITDQAEDTSEKGSDNAGIVGNEESQIKSGQNIPRISLKPIISDVIKKKLLKSSPYGPDISIEYTEKAIRDLKFLKKEVRSLKYKELRIIDQLYKDAGEEKEDPVELYDTAQLCLPDGKASYMTPIIAEEHREETIVIKGNTRCFRLYKEKGLDHKVRLFIVRNAPELVYKGEILQRFSIEVMRLSEGKDRGKIYLDERRQFDQALRPDNSYLK